ncbi:MAG TPA: magnesium transporter [Polyangiaceae bacterium]|nr:magnesium transporter [Polyangiaceae bacterium]
MRRASERPTPDDELTAADLREIWSILSLDERVQGFRVLPREEAENLLFGLTDSDLTRLVLALKPSDRRYWIRLLPPDDIADLIQGAPVEEREGLLALLDERTRHEVNALLAYAEDEAGGLMNPRYARVRPDMTIDEAVSYLRKLARQQLGTFNYAYVLDEQQRLLGVISLRELFASSGERKVRDAMQTEVVTLQDNVDQETVSRIFAETNLVAIPVVDADGLMKGVVTVDDVVDVVQEEATEDIQKFGGMAALEAPYLATGFVEMVKKRGGVLAVLFVGEMLTATAMSHYEDEVARAVVLALFVPLIISSGGNSGSQASTLVIRAMALGEVQLRDVFRVLRREIGAGFAMGSGLALLGFTRVVVWQQLWPIYGKHYLLVASAVALSLIGVVMLGTVTGGLLPFLLKRVGLDPASSSAPFVATIVDVAGLVIYFTVASTVLAGTVL